MKCGRKSPAQENIFPLPLVIGVTGHRDLREEDRVPLEEAVQKIFDELHGICPHTPLLLLSPLAEGADRLVARVALEKGVRLVVPLPMPQALYEEDFQTEASHEEFLSLLKQAEQYFDLSLLNKPEGEEPLHRELVRDRRYAYARVGAYIALHCQILIALWDGNYPKKIGGTSQVVRFQREGVPEAYSPHQSLLDAPENGWVYQIVTPRLSNPVPLERPFTLVRLAPVNKLGSETNALRAEHSSNEERIFDESLSSQARRALRRFLTRSFFSWSCTEEGDGKKLREEGKAKVTPQEVKSAFQSLDDFNRDGTSETACSKTVQDQSKHDLSEGLETLPLPTMVRQTLTCYARLYAIADALAIYFKQRTGRTLFSLFGLSFIAVTFFAIYAHLTRPEILQIPNFLPLIFYVALLLIAGFLWWNRISRGHYKNKYLDYRALAEGLRVQFFWYLAGVPDTVAIHYLRKQIGKLDWIRNSIRIANLLYDPPAEDALASSSPHYFTDRYHLILRQWMIDQSKYFTNAAVRDEKKLEWNDLVVHISLLVGIVLAGVLLALQLPLGAPKWLEDLLIVIMTLALILAALKEGYADKQAYAEEIEQYRRMSYLFGQASQSFQSFLKRKQPQEAERLIRELGKEALAENGNWVILHHARAIRVPIEG